MSVNFSAKNDKYPAKLTLVDDKIAPTDRIVFSEAYFKITSECVGIYGFLASQSIGLTNYKDKDWKPDAQEAFLFVHSSKKQKWNDSIKKYEQVEVSASEKYLFALLSDKLKVLDPLAPVCLSLVPYVPPMFFELVNEQSKPGLDAATFQVQAKMLEKMIENICVLAVVSQKELGDEHRWLLEKETNGSARTWNGAKGETESEKLEARWQFVKKHLASVGQFETVGDIAIAIVNCPDQLQRDRTCEAISILSQLLP